MNIPIRLELRDGTSKWRAVKDCEHATLCRAFGLDQASFYFDLPSSVRGVGSNMSGLGGNRRNRVINGYVLRAGDVEPFGKLSVVDPDERFRDDDPSDMRDFLNLSRTNVR